MFRSTDIAVSQNKPHKKKLSRTLSGRFAKNLNSFSELVSNIQDNLSYSTLKDQSRLRIDSFSIRDSEEKVLELK